MSAVATALDEPARAPEAADGPGSASRPNRHAAWPLVLLLAGFPLWWVLGLSSLLPIALAVPMLVQLLRNRSVRIPRGGGWWLLFLLFVLVSVAALWADAPGAVPGGGPQRLLVFAYRLGWYGACTVAMLWVGNADERDVPTQRICRLFSWMFLVTVAGGILGMLAPRFELTSLVQALLPHSIAANPFVDSIVHPAAANLTAFLGHAEYRPIAPFAFANSWGSNLSMFLPFFLLTWLRKGARWRRPVGVVILVISAFPIVYSMNRGLWGSLAAGIALLLLRLIMKGQTKVLLVTCLGVAIAAALFVLSPLAAVSADTLDSAHSNDRRGMLLTQTVKSTVEGSPIIGFGSTRDVQGTFASIAGGSTPNCPACAVPPLGTQGHLWLVIFSQGLLGACCFLLFFLSQIRAHWRARTPVEFAGIAVLLFFAIQMFIYDTLGMPLYVIMITIGLMWRERQRAEGIAAVSRCMQDFLRPARRYFPLLLSFTVVGAATGTALVSADPPEYSAKVSLLLAPSPLYLVTDSNVSANARDTTIDTEAALVLSNRNLEQVASQLGISDPDQLRSRIFVTAAANSRVLTIEYQGPTPSGTSAGAAALAQEYLNARSGYMSQRRDQVLQSLRDRLSQLQAYGDRITLPAAPDGSPQPPSAFAMTEQVRASIDTLSLGPTAAGEVIRTGATTKLRGQPEVEIASAALLGLLLGILLVIFHRSAEVVTTSRQFRQSRGLDRLIAVQRILTRKRKTQTK